MDSRSIAHGNQDISVEPALLAEEGETPKKRQKVTRLTGYPFTALGWLGGAGVGESLRRNLAIAFALLITLAGLGLRFYRLSNQSFWTDEIASMKVARVPLDRIVQESAENNSLPTFFLLLRAIVGDSNENIEFRARSLSALAGALSIPVFIGVVYLWRRHRGAALLAGLLLATNPLHIWYSQEVRAYALMIFFGLLAVLCYELARLDPAGAHPLDRARVQGSKLRALDRNRALRAAAWAGYFGFAVAGITLHKTALVFPVACALWHGWAIRRERGRFRSLWVHGAVLAAALVGLMVKSYMPPGRTGSILEIGYTFMTFVGGYSFGPSQTEIQSHGAWAAVSRHPIQVGILLAVLLSIGLACVLRFRSIISGKETPLLFLAVGSAAAGALLSTFPYNVRYTLPGLLAFLALVAAFAARPSRDYLSRLAIAGVLLTGLWADAQWFFVPAYRKNDSRAVAQWLVDNEGRLKSWTVLPTYLSHSVEWYLQGHPEVLSGLQPAKQRGTTSFPPVPDVLIIGRRHHVLEPDQLIASYQSYAGQTRVIRQFAGFELYVHDPEQKMIPSTILPPPDREGRDAGQPPGPNRSVP